MSTSLLPDEADRRYYRYGVAVNEDRAIPCNIDGLKPVARRALWAVHKLGGNSKSKLNKSALFVGETMGSYHPHGDGAIYDTFVTMVNSCYPLIYGEGNWGSISDKSVAAMRYTLMRMSKYSEQVFFHPFYLPTLQLTPNYDDSKEEPLYLTPLLPNLLLNGNFGIGVGARTEIPSYTIESITKLLKKLLTEGRSCNEKDCLKLDFKTLYGGKADTSDSKTLLSFYKTGKGRVSYSSIYTREGNAIHVTGFAPFSSLEKAIEKALNDEAVVGANDISDVKDRVGRVEIQFKRTLKGKELDKAIERVMQNAFSATENYDIKVTHRFLQENGQGSAKLSPSTVPELLNEWIAFRIDLEKKACSYWINKRQEEIAYQELLRLAVKNRALIIKALDKPLDEKGLSEYLAKVWKITVDQANLILDLKVRQLRALEDKKLVAKIKALKEDISGFEKRKKKPSEYVAAQIGEILKSLK